MSHFRWISRAAVAATFALGASAQLSAVEAGPIAIHGAVSVTAAMSDRYNFLGDTKDSPSLNIVEATLNGSHRFASQDTRRRRLRRSWRRDECR